MNRAVAWAAGLAALVAVGSAPALARDEPRIDWRGDLLYMAEQLKLRHPNPFHDVSEAEFDARVSDLSARIGSLTDLRAAMELQRLLATLHEGHTGLRYIQPEFGAQGFPVRFQAFSDGLLVQAIGRDRSDLLGAQLIAIGETSISEAVDRISEIVSADNSSAARRQIPFLLSVNLVLHGLGIIPEPDRVAYTLRKRDGEIERLTVSARPVAEVEALLEPGIDLAAGGDWVRLRDAASSREPLWLSRPEDLYWFQFLPDSRTVYAQVNRLYDRGGFNFREFTRALFETFDSSGAERLVIDLRRNSGGDHIDLPFVHEIVRRPALQERGRLFVLIGGSTFSAAQTFINHLAGHANPIFVGEPTGQRPNMYGVVGRFTLPSSGLVVVHSRYYIQGADPADYRVWTAPDLPVAYTSSDYAGNRDPVMSAAVAFRPAPLPDLAAVMGDAYESGGMEAALAAYRRVKPAYVAQGMTTEPIINSLGYELLRDRHIEEGLTLFRLNVEAYPASVNVHDSLAEGLLAAGRPAEALHAARAALAINPSNLDARRRVRLLETQANCTGGEGTSCGLNR